MFFGISSYMGGSRALRSISVVYELPVRQTSSSCVRKTSAKLSIWTQGLRLTALLSLMHHIWVRFMQKQQMGQLNAYPRLLS